jgi:hypothetical protein
MYRPIYYTIIKSITTYGCEVWQIEEKHYWLLKCKWRRSARISGKEKVKN